MTAPPFLRPLAEADDEGLCGGKAAGLAGLIRSGAPTPPGVVIETREFDAHVARCGLDGEAVAWMVDLAQISSAELERRSRALRAALQREPLAAALAAALRGQFDRLRPGARLVVRSSAVGEDAPQASFAGQFDSVLAVASPAALEDAVRQVWASAYGVRALRYGQHRQLRPARMAVIIQEQVDAFCSGVLFTRDPSHPQDEHMLTEYCAGLCDGLVSGALTPARARIARDSLHIEVELAGEDAPALDAGTQAALAAIARHALAQERQLGQALDIEWSITRDGAPMLLQCRPMTASAPLATTQWWSNANIAENFPGPVVPLLRSFVARGYAGYFRGLGLAFGISRRHMQAMAPALDGLVGVHAGRLYYNLSNIHTVLHLAPGGRWLARFFNQFTGAEGMPEPRRVVSTLPARIAQAVRIAFRLPWQYASVQRRIFRFERMVDAFATRTHPAALRQASMPELRQRLRDFLDIRLRRWTDAALADTAAMVCYGLLQVMLARWLRGRDNAPLQNNLLQGLPGLASAIPVEKLWALAQCARADATVLAVLRGATADDALRALQAPAHGPFRAALDEYLEHWGFRYSGELMLTQPTPAESPGSVIRLLQTYVAEQRTGPAQITAERAAERLAATAKVAALLTPSPLLRRLPLPTRARAFGLLLAATQGAIRLRERARMKQALLYTRLRHVALSLGDRLVAQQALQLRDDLFYLTIDEAIALADGAQPAHLGAMIATRRAELLACEALSPPDQFSLAPGASWVQGSAAAPAGDRRPGVPMQGLGACGGSVVGPAAVVLDVTEADTLAEGTILVTRQTDPGWAAVFFLVKGLVVERGGMLSHGAIIAREYGIPAVVGVRGATLSIRNGSRLHVDGDAGLVELRDA